jgi:hypothetical protein
LSKKRRKLQIIGAFFPELGTKEDAKKGLLPYSKKEDAIHTIPYLTSITSRQTANPAKAGDAKLEGLKQQVGIDLAKPASCRTIWIGVFCNIGSCAKQFLMDNGSFQRNSDGLRSRSALLGDFFVCQGSGNGSRTSIGSSSLGRRS